MSPGRLVLISATPAGFDRSMNSLSKGSRYPRMRRAVAERPRMPAHAARRERADRRTDAIPTPAETHINTAKGIMALVG